MAPLQQQLVSVPFGQGVDTKTDPRHVVPGKLLTLENGEFTKLGSIQKRNGYTKPSYSVFTSGKKLAAGGSIFARNSELCLVAQQARSADDLIAEDDGWKVFTLDDQADKLHQIGTSMPFSLSVETAFRADKRWIMPDADIGSGYTCYVACGDTTAPVSTNGKVWYSLIETSTGAKILGELDLGANSTRSPHVVAVGDSFHIWACIPGTSALLAILDTTTLASPPSTMTAKRSDVHADGLFDACYWDSASFGDCSVIAYKEDTSGPGYLNVIRYDEGGTQRGGVFTTKVIKGVVCCQRVYDYDAAAYYLAVGYQLNADGKIYVDLYDDNFTGVVTNRLVTDTTAAEAPRNLTCIEDPSYNAGTAADSSIRFYIEVPGTSGGWDNFIRTATVKFGAAAQSDEETFYNAGLASKAFTHGSKARVWMVYDSDVQSTLFLRSVDGSATRTDARALAWYADGVSAHQGLPQVVEVSPNNYLLAALRRDRLAADGDVIKSLVGLFFDLSNQAGMDADVGPVTVRTDGGLLAQADGRYAELGFHLYPDPLSATTAAAGGNFSDGTYYHKAVYEWTDHAGQIHRSAPSAALETTCSHGGGSQLITLTIPCLHQGEPDKLEDVQIAVYRLCSDGNYHRCTEGFGTNDNDLTASSITFADSDTDANLLANELIYTTGGVLENNCAPAAEVMCYAKGRIWLVPQDDQENLWGSKKWMHGEGLAFSNTLTKRISVGGATKALAELDGSVVVFKSDSIRTFGGDGPNDLGIGQWTDDVMLTSDVGCKTRKSVVRTDRGVMFQSHKGIYLLTRAGQVQYIGAPVEDWNDYDVVDAELVQSKSQVRFVMSNNDCLVYDYHVSQWSVFKTHASVDTCLHDGVYTRLQSNGSVLVESETAYDDDGAAISLRLKTAWLKLAQHLQGLQRVYWLGLVGETTNAHTLTIKLYHDFDDTLVETISITADATFLSNKPYQGRIMPQRQRCQALQIEIYDTDTSPFGGLTLAGLALQVGLIPGMARLGATKTW